MLCGIQSLATFDAVGSSSEFVDLSRTVDMPSVGNVLGIRKYFQEVCWLENLLT